MEVAVPNLRATGDMETGWVIMKIMVTKEVQPGMDVSAKKITIVILVTAIVIAKMMTSVPVMMTGDMKNIKDIVRTMMIIPRKITDAIVKKVVVVHAAPVAVVAKANICLIKLL